MAKTLVTIIECTRCQAPQVFKPGSMDSDVPVALYVDLDGGYMNFIDNTFDSEEYKLLFCHKCAHEFVKWANVPAIAEHGHPRTKEEYCNGWTISEQEVQKQIDYVNENWHKHFKGQFPNSR